jgi:hypothetical protein
MLTKGTEDYKKASKMANKLQDLANVERWNNNSYWNIAFCNFGHAIDNIKKTNTFAAKIAETVDKSMNPYGFKIANLSSKQAWILACCMVENNISID